MKRVPLTRAQRFLFAMVVAGVLLGALSFVVSRSVWSSPVGVLLAAAVLIVAWLASLSSDSGAPSPEHLKARVGAGSRRAIARQVLLWIVILILLYAVVRISANGT